MNWNLENMTVAGTYLDMFPVKGFVETSRVKYGGGVQHTVVLEKPINVFGHERQRVLVDHKDITQVWS